MAQGTYITEKDFVFNLPTVNYCVTFLLLNMFICLRLLVKCFCAIKVTNYTCYEFKSCISELT